MKKSIKDTGSAYPKLFAWCSGYNNKISIINLKTMQSHANFDGVQLKMKSQYSNGWRHLKEIPNTGLLVSVQNNDLKANLGVFDVSWKGRAKKIYSFVEVSGETGNGDVTYNSKRNILGAISLDRKIAYHLFTVDTNASDTKNIVKLNRKSKWHSQQCSQFENYIIGLDFDPNGEAVATLDLNGKCVISDVNTNKCGLDLQVGEYQDVVGRCRWSTNIGEPLLYVKHDYLWLNILDIEKKALTLRDSIGLDEYERWAYWIDVCQSNGNLLAAASEDKIIKVFDKRQAKIVKKFKGIHRGNNNIICVRWSPSGDMLASASRDKTARLIDFKTEKVIYTGISFSGGCKFLHFSSHYAYLIIRGS